MRIFTNFYPKVLALTALLCCPILFLQGGHSNVDAEKSAEPNVESVTICADDIEETTLSLSLSDTYSSIEDVDCDPNLTVNNTGSCPIDIYLWLTSGDVYHTTIQPGGSWGVSTTAGAMWRATSSPTNWSNLLFDQSYTVSSDCHQTWNLSPMYCNSSCPSSLTCVPCTRTPTNTTHCISSIVYQTYLKTESKGSSHLTGAIGAVWEECTDGTARYHSAGTYGSDYVTFDIFFSGKTTNPPMGSPKDHSCLHPNTNGWMYYEETCGTVTSTQHGTFSVSRQGPAFQMGAGANVTSNTLAFGGSGWFDLNGGDGYYTNGDV